jgi:hypothetical protein
MKLTLFFGYIVSYAAAVAAPIFIDPVLTTHVRYGPRSYPFAPLTVLILIVLAVSEFRMLRRIEHSNLLYKSLIPYSVCLAVTLPLFGPEWLHGNITFVWWNVLLISAMGITIEISSKDLLLDDNRLQTPAAAQREYLREAISMSKQTIFALLAIYMGFVIGWYSRVLDNVKEIVMEDGESFLLSRNVDALFWGITLYFMVCPVYSAFQTTHRLLKQMKRIGEQGDSPEGNRGQAIKAGGRE